MYFIGIKIYAVDYRESKQALFCSEDSCSHVYFQGFPPSKEVAV
jgi:hypothetical protein